MEFPKRETSIRYLNMYSWSDLNETKEPLCRIIKWKYKKLVSLRLCVAEDDSQESFNKVSKLRATTLKTIRIVMMNTLVPYVKVSSIISIHAVDGDATYI